MNKFISAFPGTGKSTLFWNAQRFGMYALNIEGTPAFRSPNVGDLPYLYDSDSSTFAKSHFPMNYIKHMKDIVVRHAGDRDFTMLVSSHDNVREAMSENGIDYILVYPDRSLKDEYIKRYKDRNSSDFFVKLMEDKWDDFIDSCERDQCPNKVVLQAGQYINSIF